MGKNTKAICLMLAALYTAGAPLHGQTSHDGEGELIVNVEWVAERLGSSDLVVVEVGGNPERYEEAHIPGAVFIPVSAFSWAGPPGREWAMEIRPVNELREALEAVGLRDDATIVAYSQGDPRAAARFWLTMDYLGHADHVKVMDAGLEGWRAAGQLTSRTEPDVHRGSLTVHPRTDMLVEADWIHERLGDEHTLLLDARPTDEYTGDDGGMGGMANPGHIPGAVHLYWEELVEEGGDRPLLDRAELTERLENAGATGDKTLVIYCMIGWRASLNYLAARHLGYDVRFYDGSWHDWGTRDDLPYVSGAEPGGR